MDSFSITKAPLTSECVAETYKMRGCPYSRPENVEGAQDIASNLHRFSVTLLPTPFLWTPEHSEEWEASLCLFHY
jgi:hypothetical protein